MAIYDSGTASLDATGKVTGVGTTWQAQLTLVRVGATIVFKTEPVKIYTVSEILSDTEINVFNPNSETVQAGTGYAILLHDGITVQGLAQDVAETLRYYQSNESYVAQALDAFNNFDANDFDTKVNQVNTQYGDIVTIGTQVANDAAQAATDKDAAAASASSASSDKDAASASAQEAAYYAASLDTQNLLRKDLALSDITDKPSARENLNVYSKDEVIGGYVTPEEFGAKGDGISDDVAALRDCFLFAASSTTRKKVTGRSGSKYYTSSVITIPTGVVEISNMNILSDYLAGAVFSTNLSDSYDGLSFYNVNIDLMGKGQRGVIFSGIKKCKIFNNKIFNFGSAQSESYGIRIGTSSTTVINEYCDVYGNIVTMPTDPTGGLGSFGWAGIYMLAPNNLLSDGSVDWTNQYNTIRYIDVYGNNVTGGTHNIQAMGLFNVNIQNNTLDGGSHRNINLGFGSQRVLISGNKLLGASSSAVIFGGARFVKISGNYIQSSSTAAIQTDDAAIQFAQGCYSIDVSGNDVYGSWDYGVNLFNSNDVRISSNYFESAMAGVAIQSSQTSSVPATAIYTRTRSVTELVSSSTSRISLSGNTYKSGSSGCCIYIAAINSVAISDVSISGETFTGASGMQHAIYVYQGANAQISRVSLSGVSAPMISSGKYYSAYGRSPFRRIDNVDGLEDDFSEVSIAAASNVSAFYGPNIAISSSGTINNFTDGIDGQQINVRLTSGVVIVNNSSLIRLNGSANYTATSSSEIISLTKRAGIWFELSRSS